MVLEQESRCVARSSAPVPRGGMSGRKKVDCGGCGGVSPTVARRHLAIGRVVGMRPQNHSLGCVLSSRNATFTPRAMAPRCDGGKHATPMLAKYFIWGTGGAGVHAHRSW